MSLNILRFPSFQSVNIIDQANKNVLADRIESTLDKVKDILRPWELNQITRLTKYLKNVTISSEDTDALDKKTGDFKNFTQQYSVRRKMPIETHFTSDMLNWYNTL